MRQKLSNLPRDLEQCYEEMIRRIMRGAEKDQQRGRDGRELHISKTKMMLSWATYACRPLTFAEFRDIIAIGDIQQQELSLDTTNVSAASLLSEYRLGSEKQVHKAVLHYCGGFLEPIGAVKYTHTQSRHHI